ncbi:MAG: thioredoxin [Zoogloeaceae bacterium]|jgi:thioredoxin 1|nr:thioredoxin [Zoogloeaceae bacterium]
MSDEHIVHITSSEAFTEEVLNSDVPVLVDFWAEWCGPCKMMMPSIDEVAKDFVGKLKVVKIDVDNVDADKDQKLTAHYHIRGIPTLMMFKDGNVEETKVGAMSKSQIISMIDNHL